MMLELDLAERRVLVVGGGRIATRRVGCLLADGARVTVVSPLVCPDLQRLVDAGVVALVRREVRADDLDGVWFVVAATDSPQVDERVAGWADERRAWCINGSRSGSGSAKQAASTTHGPVTVGVVSSGAPDPRRSMAIRDAIADLFGSGSLPA